MKERMMEELADNRVKDIEKIPIKERSSFSLNRQCGSCQLDGKSLK